MKRIFNNKIIPSDHETLKISGLISNIDGFLLPREASFLYLAARYGAGKGDIVEIGTYRGRATVCLAQGVKDRGAGKVFTIDPYRNFWTSTPDRPRFLFRSAGSRKIFSRNIKNAGLNENVKLLPTTSFKAAEKWSSKIRMLWIDGRHEYEHVKKDFDLWEPFLSIGGTIAIHDIGFMGPRIVILNNIYSSNRFKSIFKVDDTLFAIKAKG